MVTFICYNICKYFKGCFKPSKSPEIPDPNMAYSSPSRSPDRTPPNLQPISNPISQPAQNLEIFMEKDFYKLTTDEKYFSLEELTYYKDKYPSPTRKPLKKIRWKPGDFLGQGSYGTVVMGFNAVTGEIMAVKQVNVQGDEKSENNEKVASLESEIALLMQFEHPNIVRYLGTNRTRNKFNIFLEYISGGSIAFLLKKYGKFNENIVRQYTFQILKGLEYLHWHKVLHRGFGVKRRNI